MWEQEVESVLRGRGWRETDRADVLKERPGGHEVARVQDNGGQHVEEEGVAGQHRGGLLVDRVHDATNDQTNADEEARLRNPDSDLVVHMETWEERCELNELSKNTRSQTPLL